MIKGESMKVSEVIRPNETVIVKGVPLDDHQLDDHQRLLMDKMRIEVAKLDALRRSTPIKTPVDHTRNDEAVEVERAMTEAASMLRWWLERYSGRMRDECVSKSIDLVSQAIAEIER